MEAGHAQILLGIDVLEQEAFAPLKGKRIGLITNDSSLDGRGRRTLDVLKNAPGVRLTVLFSPEHGLTAHIGAGLPVSGSTDTVTGLPIYSLYGETRRPPLEMLKGLDALVFDIQDIGTRFYTYATTMAYCLEEAARAGIEFFVLDRPNPVTGMIVEGQVLEPGIKDFTAYFHVPIRHGLTMGEIARFHNEDAGLGARLTVIPMKGWKRVMWWQDTGLRFEPPSPNIRTPMAALLYGGIGCFEATNVSVGRGTERPFEIFGAPWMNSNALVRRLRTANLPGVRFKTATFTPSSDLYQGKQCQGVQVVVRNRDIIHPIEIFVRAAMALAILHPKDFQPRWEEVAKMTGSRALEEAVKRGETPESLLRAYHQSSRIFDENRKRLLIYED